MTNYLMFCMHLCLSHFLFSLLIIMMMIIFVSVDKIANSKKKNLNYIIVCANVNIMFKKLMISCKF
jgi:hypothetical protein